MQGVHGADILLADHARHHGRALVAGEAQGQVHVGPADHEVAGADVASPDCLPEHVVRGDILRIRKLSERQSAVVQFRARLVQGIADQVGHDHFPGDDGIDGQEDAAAFLHGGPGLGRLPIHDAGAQPPHEHGIRHLHAHMARAGGFVRLRDRHIRKVRHRHRPVMPRDEAQPHLRDQEQPHDQQGRQQQIPHNPVAQNPFGLGLHLVLAIFLCHGKFAFYLSTYKVINNSQILRKQSMYYRSTLKVSDGPAS